jgi:hypothetical protein
VKFPFLDDFIARDCELVDNGRAGDALERPFKPYPSRRGRVLTWRVPCPGARCRVDARLTAVIGGRRRLIGRTVTKRSHATPVRIAVRLPRPASGRRVRVQFATGGGSGYSFTIRL